MDAQVEVEAAAENVLAEVALGLGVVDGCLQLAIGFMVLAPQEDVALGRADGVGTDDHAFHQQVRVVFQQIAVLEGARLHLVAIANEVLEPSV